MEPNNIYIGMIKGIITCFTNLNSIKDHFKVDLIQTLCSCNDNQNMALLSAGKELIDKYNNQDMFESILDTFTIEYISLFNNSYNEQNKTMNCLNIISNIIEKWHKEENFESRNYNENTLKNQSFENETKKEFMLVLFMDYVEAINTSILSKIIFSSNILIKECTLCNSITYNFEIQKIFQFNIDEVIDYKSQKNNNEEILIVSLDDCFNYFISPKNNNNCKCKKEGCNSSCSNIKKVLYWTNNIIIIYLYRSIYNKMYTDVDIDKTLDLSKYLDKDSLKNLTMPDNKIMSYVYDLSSMFYFNGSEYITSYRKNKNEDIWYYSFDGMKPEECINIFNQLSQFETLQPVLLFYEYKNDPNVGIRDNLENENFLLWEDNELESQPKKEVNKNSNLNNEGIIKNDVKKEDNNLIKNQEKPEIMDKKDIKNKNLRNDDFNKEFDQIKLDNNNKENSNNINMNLNDNIINMNINNEMNMNNILGQNNMINNMMVNNMMNNMMGNNMMNNMMVNNMMVNNNMMCNNMMVNNNMMNMMGKNMMGNNMMANNNMMNMNMMGNNMMNMNMMNNMMGYNMMGNNMMGNNNMMNNNMMGNNNMMNMMGNNNMINFNNQMNNNNINNMNLLNNNFNMNNQINHLSNSMDINMNQINHLNNNMNLMMDQNINFNRNNSMNININPNSGNDNNNSNFFTVDFKFIKKNKESFTLKVQTSNGASIKDLINNFKTKLADNSIVIEKYLLNNNEELDRNSDQLISFKGINNNSIITAIEANNA